MATISQDPPSSHPRRNPRVGTSNVQQTPPTMGNILPPLGFPFQSPPSREMCLPRVGRETNQPNSPPLAVLHSSTPKASPLNSVDDKKASPLQNEDLNNINWNDWTEFELDSNALDLNNGIAVKKDSKNDGLHKMIADLANIENEVDNEMSNTRKTDSLSHLHLNEQLGKETLPEPSSSKSVSGRLSDQARRGWVYENGGMVHQALGWRQPNFVEKAFFKPNNRFLRRKQRRAEREALQMDVDLQEPAQDRLLKRGPSQLEDTTKVSPEGKKPKGEDKVSGCLTEEEAKAEHKKKLMETTEKIVAEEKAKKEQQAKEKRAADIKYWQDPEVKKMTGRIVTSKRGVRMTQLDIPRISHLHSVAMDEKIGDDEVEKIDKVTPLRIGLGGRGLKLHLPHEDGWAWWTELIAGIPPLDEEDGGYTYKFLRPGQEPFKYFTCTMSDPRLADKDDGVNVFQRAVRRQNRPLARVPFTPSVVGMSSVDMIPSTVIQMCVAVEDILAFELAMDELGWQICMGIEKHRVTASRPPRRWPNRRAPGVGEGPSLGGGLEPRTEADEYTEEEAMDEAQMEEHMEDDPAMDMDKDKEKNGNGSTGPAHGAHAKEI